MLDALISAGANLLGGWLNRNSQEQFNQAQMALAHENLDFQKAAAHSGIQWKVQDAMAAGVHPLAALGANTFSPSPVTAGGEAPKMDFGSMGQDLGRAAKAMMSAQTREEIDNATARKLENENKGLQNDVLRAELASKLARTTTRSGQIAPPVPSPDRVPIPRPGPARTVSEGAAVSDDKIEQKAEDYPATKVVRPFGYPLQANPWFNDGQQFEDRYGDSEVGSTIKFGINTIADHLYTGYSKYPWLSAGSGQMFKRFRRGRYTAPSYRPWAE